MSTKTQIRQAVETMEGDGVTVRRLFPVAGLRNHDPFVLWDHFQITSGHGFPTHPHRGFEAITYLFSGTMEHTDNLGNQSTIGAGGAQRFTAGRGIVHSEMPGTSGITEGIQLWINLSLSQKKIDPAYQAAEPHEIETEKWDGGWRRVIVGQGSPVQLQTPVDYFELGLAPGSHYQWTPAPDHCGLIYVVDGEVSVNDNKLAPGDALHIDGAETLDFISVKDVHLMVCFGQPHGEPIYQHGPYVD